MVVETGNGQVNSYNQCSIPHGRCTGALLGQPVCEYARERGRGTHPPLDDEGSSPVASLLSLLCTYKERENRCSRTHSQHSCRQSLLRRVFKQDNLLFPFSLIVLLPLSRTPNLHIPYVWTVYLSSFNFFSIEIDIYLL